MPKNPIEQLMLDNQGNVINIFGSVGSGKSLRAICFVTDIIKSYFGMNEINDKILTLSELLNERPQIMILCESASHYNKYIKDQLFFDKPNQFNEEYLLKVAPAIDQPLTLESVIAYLDEYNIKHLVIDNYIFQEEYAENKTMALKSRMMNKLTTYCQSKKITLLVLLNLREDMGVSSLTNAYMGTQQSHSASLILKIKRDPKANKTYAEVIKNRQGQVGLKVELEDNY